MIRLRRIPPNRVESTPLGSGLPPNVPPNVPPNAIQLADGGYAVLEQECDAWNEEKGHFKKWADVEVIGE